MAEQVAYFSPRRGARIAAMDKSATALQETFDEVHKQTGSMITVVECDVTDPVSVENAICCRQVAVWWY